jgi:hypothetical protein
MTRAIPTLLLPSLFLLTLSACDGSGSNGDDQQIPSQQGTFQAKVTGAVTVEVTGTASSGAAAGRWGLAMTVTTTKAGGYSAITLVRNAAARPTEGDYTVGNADPESGDFYGSAVIDNVSFTGVSGSVSVVSSTEERVTGTFTFTARTGTVANPQTIIVAGGFNSRDNLDL